MKEINFRVSDFAMLEINYNVLAEANTVSVVYFDLDNKIKFKPSSSGDESFSSFFPVCVEGINGVCHIKLDDCGQTRSEEELSIKLLIHGLTNQCKNIFVRHDLAIDIINNFCFITDNEVIQPSKFNLVDDSVFMSVPDLNLNLFSGYDSNKSVHRALCWVHAIQCHLHKNE